MLFNGNELHRTRPSVALTNCCMVPDVIGRSFTSPFSCNILTYPRNQHFHLLGEFRIRTNCPIEFGIRSILMHAMASSPNRLI